MRILVADDSPDFAAMVAALGAETGHEVDVALSGRQAIDAAAAYRPDIAFIDLTLPDMPGWDVAEAILHNYRGREPVLIACSGRDPTDPSVRNLLTGFSDYLMKGRLPLERIERAIASAAEDARSSEPT